MNNLHRLAVAAGLALGVASAPADAGTLRYSGIHFFGDSLTDPGNAAALLEGVRASLSPPLRDLVPPFPPAFPLGKASDGPLWSERIAADFAAAGLRTGNFAFASAQVGPDEPIFPLLPGVSINLPSQIRRFQAATPGPLPGNDVAVFWIGNNDMLGLIGGAGLTPDNDLSPADRDTLAAQAAGLAGLVVDAAALLRPHGIEDFVFLKLPDFGLIPRFNLPDPFGDPARAGVASRGAELFNDALADAVEDLAGMGARTALFDFDMALRAALADPAALGVEFAGLPCLAIIGLTPSIADLAQCSEHFFYDDIHPTAALHAVLADEFRRFVHVQPIPLPAAGWLLLVAVAGLGGLGRARRRA